MNYLESFPLNDTLCKNCKYRFSRFIIPIDYEEYGIDIDNMDLDEDDEVIIEQHICLILHEDLDGAVKECSSYCPNRDVNFFSRNPYQGD